MIEYHIILNVYQAANGGRTIKHVLRCTDRDLAIEKFKYLGELVVDKKRTRDLKEWCEDNGIIGQIVSTDGLFGVSYIKILP
jgi:hypothetical protein